MDWPWCCCVLAGWLQSGNPLWDDFFVFDVTRPSWAVLKIKIFDHVRCWRPALIGTVGAHAPVRRGACSMQRKPCACVEGGGGVRE